MKNGIKKYLSKIIAAIVIIALLFIVSNVGNSYWLTVLNASLIYVVAVLGLSLLLGMGGMMSFATVSFMGIGAYASANLAISLGIPGILSIILAVAITVVIGGFLGLLLLRLRNAYFSFATIGIVQVFYALFLNYKPLTGGPNGMGGIPKLSLGFTTLTNAKQWLVFLVMIVIICSFILERIRSTSLGRSLAAIRDNEIVAQTQGINIYKTKMIAFMISAAFGGLAGALYAFLNSYLSAYLFTFDLSIRFLVMVMLGGVNNTMGAIIGSLIVNFLPEVFRFLEGYMKLINGIAIILLMIFMPMGIMGILGNISRWIRKKAIVRKIAATKEKKENK